jgi:hypothetical protein
MSAGDGLRRLSGWAATPASRRRMVNTLAASSLLLALFLPGNQPFWDLFELEHYRPTALHLAGRRALAHVPPHVSVVAQGAIVPHLSHRERIYVLKDGAPDADVVIAATRVNPYPNDNADAIAKLVNERRARGYSVVFDDLGWIVLRR